MREDRFKLAHEDEPRLTETLLEYHSGTDIPDGEQAWELVSRRLMEEGGIRPVSPWGYRARLAVVAVLLTLAIDLLFWAVNPVEAIARYYFKVYRDTQVTDISFGNYDMDRVDKSRMLTAPPPEEDRHGKIGPGSSYTLAPGESPPGLPEALDPLQTSDTTRRLEFAGLEEAAGRIAFPVYLPSYLPKGYVLTKVTLFLAQGEEQAGTAHLEYGNEKTRDTLTLFQHPAVGEFGMSSTITDPNVRVKEVKVDGGKGVLVQIQESYTDLQWFNEKMYYQARGRITEKDMLKLAGSMKKSSK